MNENKKILSSKMITKQYSLDMIILQVLPTTYFITLNSKGIVERFSKGTFRTVLCSQY